MGFILGDIKELLQYIFDKPNTYKELYELIQYDDSLSVPMRKNVLGRVAVQYSDDASLVNMIVYIAVTRQYENSGDGYVALRYTSDISLIGDALFANSEYFPPCKHFCGRSIELDELHAEDYATYELRSFRHVDDVKTLTKYFYQYKEDEWKCLLQIRTGSHLTSARPLCLVPRHLPTLWGVTHFLGAALRGDRFAVVRVVRELFVSCRKSGKKMFLTNITMIVRGLLLVIHKYINSY